MIDMFNVNEYFHQFLNSPKIFTDHDVLRPEYIPEQLPHRDLEIRRIAEIVACTLRNSTPSNMFLFGKTGTGKTAVVRHVAENLNAQCRACNIKEPLWIYLNCQQVNTGYRILANIAQIIDSEEKIPISGWPIDVLLDKVVQKLDEHLANTICFIILDEIDILVNNSTRTHDGILYTLARINERLAKARINLIGISNVLNFKAQLDPRVLSSLGEEEIVFPAYDSLQLKQILEQRANLAFTAGTIEQGVIPLCAALAAKEHGDARKALELLRKAGEIAERRNSMYVTIDHVRMAQDDIERDKVCEYVEKLPLQLKVVLLSTYLVQKLQPNLDIITGDIYNCYLEVQNAIPGLTTLTQRRVSELIRELDLAGILNARVVSKGRYGRTKVIRLNIALQETHKILSEDKKIAELVEYIPKCIQPNRIARFNSYTYKRIA
jgi:cell division control protein 6